MRDESTIHPAFRTKTAPTEHAAAAADDAPVITEERAEAIRKSVHFPSTSLSPARIKYLQDSVCRAELKNGKSLIMVNMSDLLAEVQDPLTTDSDELYLYAIHRREASEDEDETKSYEWKRVKGTYRNEANANAAAEQELCASEIAMRDPGRIAMNEFEVEHRVRENGRKALRLVVKGCGEVEVMVHKMRTRA